MAKKQKCPNCGKFFIYLNRHKCPLLPKNYETTKSNEKKLLDGKKNVINKLKQDISDVNINKINNNSFKSTGLIKKKKGFMEIDKEILELICTEKEIYSNEICVKLKLNPKLVERSLKRLEQKHRIIIKSDVIQGLRRDLVKFIEDYTINNPNLISSTHKGELKWDTLGNCPCFLCPFINKCNPGHQDHNPTTCPPLEEWIHCSINKIPYQNPYLRYYEEKKKKKE